MEVKPIEDGDESVLHSIHNEDEEKEKDKEKSCVLFDLPLPLRREL